MQVNRNKPTAEALRHARRRGQILETLKSEYPNPIDFAVLRRVLSNLGTNLTEEDLESYLKYLSNDNYVSCRCVSDCSILYVELCNKGLNLLDGYIGDPAIILE